MTLLILRFAGVLLVCFASGLSHADLAAKGSVTSAANLQELLEIVKAERNKERALNLQREKRFLAEKNKQKQRLSQARKQQREAQNKATPLLEATQSNQQQIENLQQTLKQKTQDLGDMQAAYRQFAGDFSASLQQSMITAEKPSRVEELDRLAALSAMPTIDDLESLWLLVQEEMTAASSVSQFDSEIVNAQGVITQKSVIRVGGFTSMSDGSFLRYVPETQELLLLSRQPPQRLLSLAEGYIASDEVLAPMVIDPTKGSLLSMISYAPNMRERIEQAGTIGLIIIALGAVGLLVTAWRAVYLCWVSLGVKAQLKNLAVPKESNPLGRILKRVQVFEVDVEENIQFKLDELVLAELPRLERGQGFIKLLAAVAPLLGLLGTVTGMILTFQSISLFGNGDPKLMAGGISQALMTTVLGLVVAIPLLFGHSFVASLSRNLVQKLDEQSAGFLAQVMEKSDD